MPLPGSTQRFLKKLAVSIRLDSQVTNVFSPARRLAEIEKRALDYEHIARKYLGRADGRLFLDPLPDPADEWTPPEPAMGQVLRGVVRLLFWGQTMKKNDAGQTEQ